MPLSRRRFLQLASLVAASVTASACTPVYRRLAGEPPLPNEWPRLSEANFTALSRMTFGPRPEERARAAEIGLAGWIEEQLAYDTLEDSALTWRLQDFETLSLSATELLDWSEDLFDDVDQQSVPRELVRASLLRQTYSRRQLYEVIVEFWSDHFNISTEKGDCFFLKTVDDREVIRPYALGHFRDLLWASAHSPAMLFYLDNQVNHKEHPNENYAREMMELHSLGVEGGYTQPDVMELARCLTGWSVKDAFWRGDFTFNPDFHDTGPKSVLGVKIEPDGQGEAERVIEMLAAHPATARFIAFKLARRFIADEPPEDLVNKGAQAFIHNQGDIRAVLRVILLDGVALAVAPLRPKFKRPVDFVVSALRLLNAQTDASPELLDYLVRLGQVPFRWPTPDGYPQVSAPWMGNLQPRWQLALALARNEVKGTQIDLPKLVQVSGAQNSAGAKDSAGANGLTELTEKISALILGAPLPAATHDNFLNSFKQVDEADLPAILLAGLIASPAFQWR